MSQNQVCLFYFYLSRNLLLEKNLLKDEIRIVIHHSDYLRRLFSSRIDSCKGYESLARGFTLTSWLFYSYLLELHVFMPFYLYLHLGFVAATPQTLHKVPRATETGKIVRWTGRRYIKNFHISSNIFLFNAGTKKIFR